MQQACSCKAFDLVLPDILINYPGRYSINTALMNLGQIKLQVPTVIINKKLLLSACASCDTLQRFLASNALSVC